MIKSAQRLPRATFNQLRTLEAVARLGSVTQAARELHLSQPTVSMQIAELQSALEVRLFEPAGRGIRLTEAGALLQQTAGQMLGLWQGFEEGIQALQGLERGVLHIAGVTTTEYFIAQRIKAFAQAHPGIEIDLAVDNRAAVVRMLESEETDLAVMMMPPDQPALETLRFLDNPLVLIGPADHPWATLQRVPRQRLNGQPLLLRERGSGTRAAVLEHLKDSGLEPLERMTLGSNEAIKHAVAAGLGLSVVSRHTLTADPGREGLAILPMAGFPIMRQWQLVWRRNRRLPLAARVFVEHVRNQH
jgi:DNA-binding transcriptional LysR family regulator